MSYSASLNGTVAGNREISLPVIVKQAVALLMTRRERARAQNRLRWELSQYSDRELGDMGLSRSDIEDVVQGRFRR
ncbi:DUF1127 domain-containing protein [Acetobacteraceae bacterium KSS8]|uniref:DUF1127 domain-containing protein n=1 Tax=Endosaccharibacter trunci TaxID=2812733 RepID=A0ABT1W2K2_9PROT|nr:DUF1127 domain-containing protein [Acetobacteraceae bacterium KSS8]